jgi:hypothetical protein
MTKAEWIKAYIANAGAASEAYLAVRAEDAYYRNYPLEKIKADPFLYFLYLQAKELEKRIKQLEDKNP